MKLKHILPFLVSMIFLSISRMMPKAQEVVLKQQLPYEITHVSADSTTLTIHGWAFINANQHFKDASTHDIFIQFNSLHDQQQFKAKLTSKSMTSTMYYRGSRWCEANEHNQAASQCNYTYNNVGFQLSVPLSTFIKNQTYSAMLVVVAKQTNKKAAIQLYYPMKQPIINKHNDYQFEIQSALKDTRLIINHENVVVRNGPTSSHPVIQGGPSCSSGYKNNLFYRKGQVFSKIVDKVMINDISVYRLKGDILGCYNYKQRVKEGESIDPMYVASPFVEYSGTPLSITNRLINEPPMLQINHPTVHVDEVFDYRKYVSVYDFEEKDLTHKIVVLSNTYQKKVGQYQVRLYVEDKHGYSDAKTMNVTVIGPRNSPPKLFVSDRTIKQFSVFDPLEGVYAYDKEDGNLTNDIKTTNSIATHLVGSYLQCYRVVDSDGAFANQCATITIIERKAIIHHRFIDEKLSTLNHPSWQTSYLSIKHQLENKAPLLGQVKR